MARDICLGRDFIKSVSQSMGIDHLPIRSIHFDAEYDDVASVRVESILENHCIQAIAGMTETCRKPKIDYTVTNGDDFSCTFGGNS